MEELSAIPGAHADIGQLEQTHASVAIVRVSGGVPVEDDLGARQVERVDGGDLDLPLYGDADHNGNGSSGCRE